MTTKTEKPIQKIAKTENPNAHLLELSGKLLFKKYCECPISKKIHQWDTKPFCFDINYSFGCEMSNNLLLISQPKNIKAKWLFIL